MSTVIVSLTFESKEPASLFASYAFAERFFVAPERLPLVTEMLPGSTLASARSMEATMPLTMASKLRWS